MQTKCFSAGKGKKDIDEELALVNNFYSYYLQHKRCEPAQAYYYMLKLFKAKMLGKNHEDAIYKSSVLKKFISL